jgi:hypothetical protein
MSVPGVLARHVRHSGRGAGEQGELLLQVAQGEVGESGADVPGVRQPVALVVHGQQQRADGAGAAPLAGLPPDNDDLLRFDQWDLGPVGRPLLASSFDQASVAFPVRCFLRAVMVSTGPGNRLRRP